MENVTQEGLPEEVTAEWQLKVEEGRVLAMPGK